ncbi:MAG TPA: FAD-binding domain [Bryobacteraceae bacterium]|nr:FAD-binding domain [Bryobacteraceae bacterium]
MRILVSGAGIAGITVAWWLRRYGFQVTIVEKTPALRSGGYIIDFWGSGFDVAERMGLLPLIRSKGYQIQQVRVVDRNSEQVTSFTADVFSKVVSGRYVSIAHGDLAEILFESLPSSIEVIFGDSIEGLEQSAQDVQVTFESGKHRPFDLVIGADGLHSQVRRLVFGPDHNFERYLGYQAAAFEAPGYEPRVELTYVMHTEVGQQIARFSMRNNRTMFLFTFAERNPHPANDISSQKSLLRRRFGNSGWECPQILAALDRSAELYFDRVSQIRMELQPALWTKGRVTLLGDAASCVSLLAGEGSSLTMAAAYLLAGELHSAAGNYARAFARYQQIFGPFVLRKQKTALRLAGTFAPKSSFSLLVRNLIFWMMNVPFLARIIAKQTVTDRISLPDYG